MTNIENELALLDAVGQLASAAQARRKKTSSAFRAFTLLDPKEVVQTRIIAALLDPCANHGQGEDFLRLFLKAVGEGDSLSDSLASTEIEREAPTKSIDSDRRRIDLLIRLPGGRVIALESKARNAGSQPDQIKQYLEHLENIAPKDNLLVYLPKRVGKPTDVCEDSWKVWTEGNPIRVRCRSYDDLIGAWLGECIASLAICSPEAATLRGFLEEFCRFTKDERSPLMGEIASSILQSKDRLIASAAITKSRDAVRQELAKRFLDSLEDQLRSKLTEAWRIGRLDDNGYYPKLTLHRSNWKNIRSAFEIGWEANEPLSEWTIGLGIHGGGNRDPSDKPSSQILEAVKRARPNGYPTDAWAWSSPEFKGKGVEFVDCLLYDKPKEQLQRLGEGLIRIGSSIQESADATQAGQGEGA